MLENQVFISCSRRLDASQQIIALHSVNVLFPDLELYLKEGRGAVYFVFRAQDTAIQQLRPSELLPQIIFKWGVTERIERRQIQYDDCDVGQTHIWVMAFYVDRRLLAGKFFLHVFSASHLTRLPERIIRLRLIEKGYPLVRFDKPCPCDVRHREYHWNIPNSSLQEIEEIALGGLQEIGERNIVK
ncbi:hypothetical protein K438DRAFT_1956891 [Mycena galopus ATCC 62051]|nr:hypothetical protein K438DRAFT_1956891 [Mycena galopus ATCC 62051]